MLDTKTEKAQALNTDPNAALDTIFGDIDLGSEETMQRQIKETLNRIASAHQPFSKAPGNDRLTHPTIHKSEAKKPPHSAARSRNQRLAIGAGAVFGMVLAYKALTAREIKLSHGSTSLWMKS